MAETKVQPSPNRLANLPEKPLPMGRISYEQFLEWAEEDTHAEWVDGEIVMPSPASYKHQNIKGFLETAIRLFVEAYDLGIVLSAGFQMKLPGETGSGREPDLLFVAKTRMAQIQTTYLQGPADLAVEIISPESVERDRQTKFAEYAEGGVPEYWLIDPTTDQATFYRLDKNNQYQAITPDGEGRYNSQALPGFWLRAEWLWQTPLPHIEEVMLDIGGETYFHRQMEKFQKRGFLPPNPL